MPKAVTLRTSLLSLALALTACSTTPPDGDAGLPADDASTQRDTSSAETEPDVVADRDPTDLGSTGEANRDDVTSSAETEPDAVADRDPTDLGSTGEASRDDVARDGSDDARDGTVTKPEGGDPDADVCGPETAPRCAPVRHVASAADLANVINTTLEWQIASLGGGHLMNISDDLTADADIQLAPSDIATPQRCGTLDGGCPQPLFRESLYPRTDGTGRVMGLTCLAPGPTIPGRAVSCSGMAIAKGTTFRVRKVQQSSMWGLGLFVEFDRACTVVCDAEETRCDANQVCFHRGFETCMWCEGTAIDVCGCRDRCNETAPDGTQCAYAESDDVDVVGVCREGRCCYGSRCPDY